MEKLIEQIDSIIKDNYEIKNKKPKNKLVFKSLNKEKGFDKGFMVFADFDKESLDEKYQYKRRYYYVEKLNGNSGKNIIFVLFNCSTSNPDELDPTVENCKWLAQKQEYNYSRIEVLNLFSIRKSKVDDINIDDLAKDDENFNFIIELLKHRDSCDIVLAWGYGKENPNSTAYKKEIKEIILKKIENFKQKIKEIEFPEEKIKKITFDTKKLQSLAMHPGRQAWSQHSLNFKNDAIIADFKIK